MNKNNIFIESLYEFKRARRSSLFRMFTILAILGLVVYQFSFLSREGGIGSVKELFRFYMDWTSQALPSSIPFKSAYYFNIIQLLFVACLTVNDSRASRLSTKGALYARPQSNTEIVIGNFLGRLLVVTVLNWFSFATSIIFNLVLYPRSFELSLYFFYWATLTLPALIYSLGISYLVTHFVRNPGISIIILFLFLGGITFGGASFLHGLFDPCARYIPNLFSDFTGHVNLENYLLQRGSILLTGVAFLVLSIIPYPRIPNCALVVRKSLGVGTVLLTLATGVAFMYHARHEAINDARKAYKQVYDKHGQLLRTRVVQQDLLLKELENGGISVNSRMKVINRTSTATPVIMYLNPGLKITSLKINGQEAPFRREHQALVLDKELTPLETCDLTIDYEGGIEKEVCFLNVTPEQYNSPGVNTHGIYHFGYTPAFCGKGYKLLTPECLWYPACVPPYDFSGGRDVNFTRYSLRVEHDPRLTAISQGDTVERREGETSFHFRHDIPSISLCIGDYKKRTITVDSTRLELYCLPSHEYLVEGYAPLEKELAKELLDTKKELESRECFGYEKPFTKEEWATINEMCDGTWSKEEAIKLVWAKRAFDPTQRHPYRWFTLLEVPCDFHCFPSLTRLTGEREQGGIVYIPEKLYPIKDYQHKVLKNEDDLIVYLHTDIDKIIGRGVCDIRTTFRGKTTSISSREYPIMNDILNNMMSGDFNMINSGDDDYSAVEYLNRNSLKDALHDNALSSDQLKNIMRKKSEELYIHIMLHLTDSQFRQFYYDFLVNNLFKETTLEEYYRQFHQSFGVRLDSLVESWYNTDGLPSFEIRDARAIQIRKTSYLPDMLYSFKVFNRSDVPGIIVTSDYQGWIIPPHEGREIRTRNRKDVFHNYYAPFFVGMPLAQNLPATIPLELEEPVNGIVDTVGGVFNVDSSAFLPNKDEIIIDNEDSGFRVVKAKGFNIVSLFREEKSRKEYYKPSFQQDKWLPIISEHFYGSPMRSALHKKAGSGDQKVEWNVQLPREGEYEVFFYHGKPDDAGEEFKQELHYIVFDGKQEHEVIAFVNAEEEGWISLGVFDFTRIAKVTLSDRGRKNGNNEHKYSQKLVADAVKWVKRME